MTEKLTQSEKQGLISCGSCKFAGVDVTNTRRFIQEEKVWEGEQRSSFFCNNLALQNSFRYLDNTCTGNPDDVVGVAIPLITVTNEQDAFYLFYKEPELQVASPLRIEGCSRCNLREEVSSGHVLDHVNKILEGCEPRAAS